MSPIELNKRQQTILQIVKEHEPITGEQIAEKLQLTRATLRPDLAILTMARFLDARPRVGYFYVGKKNTEALIERMQTLKVSDFCSKPVVVQETMSVYDAICEIFAEDVGTLFVMNEEQDLQGVLSRKDLLRASIGSQDLTKIPVHIIMTRMPNITYCEKKDTLVYAAQKLIERQVDSLPVIHKEDSRYKVVGRLTKTNITKAFLALSEIQEL